MVCRIVIATFMVVALVGPAAAQPTTAPARSTGTENRVLRDPGVPTEYRGRLAERGQSMSRVSLLRLSKPSTEYRLGGGDVIRIEIVDHEALSQPLQSLSINPSGEITIPALGAIRAEGLTASELEETIQNLFKERNLINDPEALVYVVDYQAKPIFLLGEVDNPGEYVMSQQMTITEALLMAGGMEQTGAVSLVSARYGYLHRRKPGSTAPDMLPSALTVRPEFATPGTEVIKVDLEPMRTGGLATPDIQLQKGDVFVVPRREVDQFYAIGDLRAPGTFEIPGPDSRAFLLTQAIARAGGVNPTAKQSQGILLRYDSEGKRVEIKFDFSAVLKGKAPDLQIRPNDIVFIPGSKIKTLQYGLLGIVPTAAQTRARTITTTAGR